MTAAGCEEVLVDKAIAKPVVTRPDRLGRSLEHPITLSRDPQARRVDLLVPDQDSGTSTDTGREASAPKREHLTFL